MNMKSMNLLLAALVVLPIAAEAQSLHASYPTTPPVVGKVIVESTYYFARRDYQPPVQMPAVSTTASFDTPEASAIASISAMSRRDFEGFRSLWDEGSRKIMEAKDRETGQTRDSWIKAWDRVFANNGRPELVSRIDSGDYVIVAWRIVSSDPAAKPFEFQAIMKLQGKRWFLTQEMSSDPVLRGWRKPDTHLQDVGRQLAVDDLAQ